MRLLYDQLKLVFRRRVRPFTGFSAMEPRSTVAVLVAMIATQATRNRTGPPLWHDAWWSLGCTPSYIELGQEDHGNIISEGIPDIFAFFKEHDKPTDASYVGRKEPR